jgi:Bacterial Ig-like domain (group 3)/FG-GAP-like repeat
MIRYKFLRLCGSAAMASLVFLFFSACLVIGISAQSAESAIAGSSTKSSAPSAFLVAPSIPLGYAPSSVATGDLRRTGRLDLVTADYDSGKITVFLGAGQGKFVPGVEYDAGPHPSTVLVADINGDGRPDVLVSNESEGTMSVLLGSGDGTLQSRQSYSVGFNPAFMAAGDFNGTGNVDVAVAGNSGNLLAIFLNDGNGSLQKPVLRTLSKTPTALTVADFDNDGHADIALANTDGTVSILLGKDAGQFRSLADISVASGSLSSIATGDFNKDGKIDLVVTQPGQKLASFLLGKGDGTFNAPVSYAVGHEPVSTLIADVNGDGVPDLVVINNQSNTFSMLEGIGDGTFKSSLDFVAGNAPLAAVAGDFYGSGHVDLAIINHSSQTVSVPSGYGDGTFKAARSYFSGQQPVSIASGVLKAGTKPGLVVANYCGSDLTCSSTGNVAVFLPDSSGAYHLSATYAVGAGPVSVALADVNGDKNLDIVAVNRIDKSVSVLLGVGDGTFRQPTTFPLAAAPVAIAVGDFNKDGQPDLAVLEDCATATCIGPGIVEILAGAEGGTFKSLMTYPVGYAPSALAVGDINSDKNLDIVVANRCGAQAACQSSGTCTVLLGDGTGKFTAGTAVALGNSPSSIALGNLSGAGLDLIVSRSTDNTVAVLHGNGDGTFQAAVPYAVGNKPGSLVVADFNGDGKADVAVANVSDSTASVLFGNGDGTLQPATAFAVGNSPTALTVIGGATAGHASLATADGASPSGVGTEFKVLPQVNPGTDFASFTLALTAGTNPSNVNDSVTFTAIITGDGTHVPTQNVEFAYGGTPISDCGGAAGEPVTPSGSNYTSVCITSTLTAGTGVSVTATYLPGDAVYQDSQVDSSNLTQTVAALNPTLTITGNGTSNVNAPVTFTATLGGVSFSPVTPTGTVNFTVGGVTIGGTGAGNCGAQGLVNNAGVWSASCTTSALVAGTNEVIEAVYTSGDNNFASATAPTVNQTVNPLNPTMSLSASPNSAAVGASVTITAQLAGVAFTPTTPNGLVAFTSGTPNLITNCSAQQVNAAGTATCTTSALVAPADVIQATYSQDNNFSFTGTASTTVSISQSGSVQNTLVSNVLSPVVNQPVTFTATVEAPGGLSAKPQPTGSVTFKLGLATICGPTGISASNQTATCPYAFSSVIASPGSPVTAVYTGDQNFPSSTSNVFTAIVGATSTSTKISSAPASSDANQQVTFTAVVLPTYSSATVVPAGTVVFSTATPPTAANTLCTEPISSGVVAPCPYTFTSAATSGITVYATYIPPATTNFLGSVSTVADNQVVNLDPMTTTVSATPTPSTVGATVTFTATLTPTYPESSPTVPPAGTVNFSYTGPQSGSLCAAPAGPTITINSSGVITAVCKAPLSASGTYTVTATYVGDSNFASSPGQVIQTVGAQNVTVSVPALNPSQVNQPVKFTAVVVPAVLTGPAPTGTVTFYDTSISNTTPIAGCNLVPLPAATTPPTAGQVTATCSYTLLTAGTHSVTANYGGDNNYSPFTSLVDAQVVNPAPTMVSLTSTSPLSTSVATQFVTFNATVTQSPITAPVPAGAAVPMGSIVFTSSDGTLNATADCQQNSGQNSITGPESWTASCMATFPASIALSSSSVTVTATYSGDTNFKGSGSSIVQTVQNFGIANSVTASGSITSAAGPVILSQCYSDASAGTCASSNVTDPFNPSTIALVVTSSGGFSDTLNIQCAVTNASSGATVSDPACTLSARTMSGATGTQLTYTLNTSSSTPVGAYTVTLTASDPKTVPTGSTNPALSQSTALTVYVVAVSNILSLAQGASGQENVSFNTFTAPQSDTFKSIACGAVVPFVKGTPGSPINNPGVTCTSQIPSGGVPITSGGTTTVAVSVSTAGGTTAQLQRSNAVSMAAFLGVPLLALIGWVGSRKSPRRNFFRFIGLILLLVGASYATGCGGSFTSTSTTTSTGIPAGNYLVQVVAKDQNGNTYYGAIPLNVSSN